MEIEFEFHVKGESFLVAGAVGVLRQMATFEEVAK